MTIVLKNLIVNFRDHKIVWLLALVFLVGFGTSYFSLNDAFLSDEFEFIYAASQVYNWSDFKQLMTAEIGGDFWRPAVYFSFYAHYKLFGLNPFGYHFINAVWQGLNSLLVSLLIWNLGKLYWRKISADKISPLLFAGIVGGLLFAVFPNHNETVTWLAARTDLLAFLFFAAALNAWFFYLRRIIFPENNSKLPAVLILSMAIIFSVLSYLAKEASASLILIFSLSALWHYIFFRREINFKIGSRILLPWILLTIIFTAYLIIRRQIVGYWFGGYVLTGSSEFLSLTFSDFKNWLLLPIKMLFLSVNFNYLDHFLSVKAPSLSSLTDLFWLKTVFYSLTVLFLAITSLVIARRRQIKIALPIAVFCLLFIYLTSAPAIGVLNTINPALESTRYYFFATAGLCALLAFWLSLFQGKKKYFVAMTVWLIFFAAYFFNYQPWRLASNSANSIQNAIKNQGAEINNNDWLYIVNTPDNIFGAYVFRRGLTQMINLYQPQIDQTKVISSGRGVAGMSAPACLLSQSDSFWLLQLDDQTGIAESLEKVASAKTTPTKNLEIVGKNMKLKDIEKIGDNSYKITGNSPSFILQDLNINPREIADLKFNITPENDYPWTQQHIYWTTESKPFYHEYHRHIWRFFGVSPNNPESPAQTIPVCRYPSFVFSDTIKDLKITLPFKKNEQFTMF